MKTETTEKQIQWTATRLEMETIVKIANRAEKRLGAPYRRTLMDLEATHCNGCALDLEALLAFPDLDFSHDIGGIARHIDRDTGELQDCFIPRCALPDPTTR